MTEIIELGGTSDIVKLEQEETLVVEVLGPSTVVEIAVAQGDAGNAGADGPPGPPTFPFVQDEDPDVTDGPQPVGTLWLDTDEVEGALYGLPTGGTAGQVPVKQSLTEGDAAWEDLPPSVPNGGTTGQALVKLSNVDQDFDWGAAMPTGGNQGESVVKQADGTAAWKPVAEILDLDIRPTSPNAKDDEFDGTSLDAKWTKGTSKVAVTSVANGTLRMRAAGTGFAYMLRQPAPSGDFSISAKLSPRVPVSLSDTRPGIFMAQTSSSKALVCGLGLSGGPANAMWIEHSNYSDTADWGAFNGSWSSNALGTYGGGWRYYRMRWVSASSTIFMDFSHDGIEWYAWTSRAGWSQPDRIGIVIENNTGNLTADEGLHVAWFRVN